MKRPLIWQAHWRGVATGAFWPGLPRDGRRLVGFGVLFLIAITAAVGALSWQMHRATLAQAQGNAAKLGTAIAEQTSRSVQTADLVLEGLTNQTALVAVAETTAGAGQISSVAAAFEAHVATEAMHQLLLDRAKMLPQVEAFTILDAKGRLLASSRRYPALPLDLSDRDYYSHFRDAAPRSVAAGDAGRPKSGNLGVERSFVSRPVRNRDNGGRTTYLARRVSAPDGTMLGIALAALDLGYYQDFYRALTAGSAGTTVELLRLDGTLLTQYPAGTAGEVLPAASPWFATVAAGAGTYTDVGTDPDARAMAGPDGLPAGRRIVSVHPLTDYPMVVDVGVSETDALAGWRQTTALAAACTLSGIACVALLLRALLLQFGNLAWSEASLAERNASLEATRKHMELQAAELHTSRTHLAKQSAALETTLGHMDQGIMMVDADMTVAVCNQRAMEMLNLPREMMDARPRFDEIVAYQHKIGEFTLPGAIDAVTFEWSKIVLATETYERVRPNGRVMEVHSIPLTTGGMVRTYTDITERRRSEEQVRHLAHHDGLTDLANRTSFQQQLDVAISQADRARRFGEEGTVARAAVLYLDLDGFKLINDTYGHGTGDQLLVEVGRRLRRAVRAGDTVARMGGDEFALIQPLGRLPGSSSDSWQSVEDENGGGEEEGPEALARRLVAVVAEPYSIDGVQCRVGVSIGVAVYPDHAATAEALLRHADIALYRAKASGKGTHCTYSATVDGQQHHRFLLEQDLRQAVVDGQLFLEYQPSVDATTLRVRRYEALVRWRHPVRGLVAPADFIGLAERCGLIVPIGLWVLETACAEAATWPEMPGDGTSDGETAHVSVNLSPVQFRADFPDQVAAVLRRTGLAPSRLSFEVTEGVLLEETSNVLCAMSKLRAMGVRFSLDDFGTAHAGLTYLRRFPFDVLKIDKSFVQDAVTQPEARVIVSAIVAIGTAFGLTVIAEGVETSAQLALMQRMGCAEVQGYLTGRPHPAELLP